MKNNTWRRSIFRWHQKRNAESNKCPRVSVPSKWWRHERHRNQTHFNRSLLHRPGGSLYVGRDGHGALVKLHSEVDPVSGSDLHRLLQHHGRLLPVRVLAEGADADLLVQVDVVPEGNRGYSACRCSLDLGNRDYGLRRYDTNTRLFIRSHVVPQFTKNIWHTEKNNLIIVLFSSTLIWIFRRKAEMGLIQIPPHVRSLYKNGECLLETSNIYEFRGKAWTLKVIIRQMCTVCLIGALIRLILGLWCSMFVHQEVVGDFCSLLN